jgi:hypothetical protein
MHILKVVVNLNVTCMAWQVLLLRCIPYYFAKLQCYQTDSTGFGAHRDSRTVGTVSLSWD